MTPWTEGHLNSRAGITITRNANQVYLTSTKMTPHNQAFCIWLTDGGLCDSAALLRVYLMSTLLIRIPNSDTISCPGTGWLRYILKSTLKLLSRYIGTESDISWSLLRHAGLSISCRPHLEVRDPIWSDDWSHRLHPWSPSWGFPGFSSVVR